MAGFVCLTAKVITTASHHEEIPRAPEDPFPLNNANYHGPDQKRSKDRRGNCLGGISNSWYITFAWPLNSWYPCSLAAQNQSKFKKREGKRRRGKGNKGKESKGGEGKERRRGKGKDRTNHYSL